MGQIQPGTTTTPWRMEPQGLEAACRLTWICCSQRSISDGYGEADSILIFTALPPLGWDRYSDLDDVYARGASTAGGSGDGSHSHSVTITTGGPQGLSSAGGGLVNTSSSGHTHSCSTTTSEHTNEQPYMEVIYRQRKDNQIHLEALEKGIIKLW